MGFLFILWGILALLGGLFQINPIWLYGPYEPQVVSQAAQPDWYLGWLEGALRLFPNWQFSVFGYEVPEVFVPGVLMPGLFFTVLALWPWVDRRITKDTAEHNLLDYPRDAPWRTALAVSALAFFVILTIAGGDDVIASTLGISIEATVRILRAVVILGPAVAYVAAYRLAAGLRRSERHPVKRSKIVSVRRAPEGGFVVEERETGGFRSPEERLGVDADADAEGPPEGPPDQRKVEV